MIPLAASSTGKRALDFALAVPLLLFLAPLLVLVTIMVKLGSSGPVLFKQRRTGLRGREFVIYKFRTMYCREDGAEVIQATESDIRVTRIGRFLRRTSIDELPQLLNVLRGDMSLVGPRPHALAHDRYYCRQISSYHQRFAVRPGITGLAQVRGLRGETRTIACMAARIDTDLEYLADWSLLADIRILFNSALIVFRRTGA